MFINEPPASSKFRHSKAEGAVFVRANLFFTKIALTLAVCAVTPGLASAQSFQRLGGLGGFSSIGAGVGTRGVALASALNQNFNYRPGLAASCTLISLGTLGGDNSQAGDISSDGLVVVGQASDAQNRQRPFRWTAEGGMQSLGTLPGGQTGFATSTDAVGAVVVGWAINASAQPNAFRWTAAEGLVGIGTLGGATSHAFGVSGDGSTVVGGSSTPDGIRAFRHLIASGLENLGTLPGGLFSQAEAANSDGTVVVGAATTSSGATHAFRWTPEEGMLDLGTLGNGSFSYAQDVSSDGTRVVGEARIGSAQRAFLWTVEGGMQDLNVLFASVIPPGWTLYRAESISADGRYIVGTGYNPSNYDEAWRLDTGAACPGDFNGQGTVSVQDIFDFLTAYFSNDPSADVNGSCLPVTVQDIFDYLASYFAGCR